MEKVRPTLERWKNLQANMAGRALVLKHLIMPKIVYFLSCWYPSNSDLGRLGALCRNFLWSSNFERKGYVGVAWSTCTFPKEFGGLGLSDIKLVASRNIARWLVRKVERSKGIWASLL
ncbi:hypothetical protein O6H91_07G066200 [Diphasiastrum complanatum]|uniref:Uncharacterized protein n=1 Tax=Diphasiastrum complanatum TaxID=34168 RepID=A0ACC2D668_DIPCM|nr:hypothetical protein O6H91_07G066200 [Diphasiastrum complanatum]